MREIWKVVRGYDGKYQVSNKGRVKTFYNSKKGIVKGIYRNRDGYIRVVFSKNAKDKHCSMHRVVAKAFVPNLYHRKYVNHIDGNKQNNNVENLEWVTFKQNISHAVQNGFSNWGERNHSKLKTQDILNIRRYWDEMILTAIEIAKLYSINRSYVYFIINRWNWKNI